MSGSNFIPRVNAAAEKAALSIVAVAQQHDTSIIIWADGETIAIDPFTERRARSVTIDECTSLPSDEPP
jgi:hypothetical protein